MSGRALADTGGRSMQCCSNSYLPLPQTSTLAGRRRTNKDHGKARATIIATGEMRSRKNTSSLYVYPLTSFSPYFMNTRSSFWPTTMDQDIGALKLSVQDLLSVWGEQIIGILLKGMGETFILSEDEPLTPNIDGVVAL